MLGFWIEEGTVAPGDDGPDRNEEETGLGQEEDGSSQLLLLC